MNRSQTAKELLLANVGRRVTIRMIEQAGGPGYTARNAISEAWKTFDSKEWKLTHVNHSKDEGVFDNGWILEPILPESKSNGLQSNGFSHRGKRGSHASEGVVLVGQAHEYLRSSSPDLIPSVSLANTGAEVQTAKSDGPKENMSSEANPSGSCDGRYPNSMVSPSAPTIYEGRQALLFERVT